MTIHVVGNCTIDLILSVDRFPAPGETLIARGLRRELGGKGVNQAVVARRFAAETRLTAALGRDADGDWAASALAAEGLDGSTLMRVAAPTDLSLISVAPDGENTIVSTALAADALTPEMALAALAGALPGDWLIVQGNLSFATTQAALAAARAAAVQTLLNPAPVRWPADGLWPLCDVAVVNRVEAVVCARTADPEAAAMILTAAGARAAVVTLGADGVCWQSGEAHGVRRAEPVAAIDAAGAGDSFCGALCAALASGLTFAHAIDVASRAAALCVSRRGTHASFPTSAEAEAILRDIAP
jgi:ribokinase